jgi:hypothetical protein
MHCFLCTVPCFPLRRKQGRLRVGGGGVVVPELCYLIILQVTHHVMASLANHDRSACTIDDEDRLGMHVCVELGKLSDGC